MADTKPSDSTLLGMAPGVEEQALKLLSPLMADNSYIYFLYKNYAWHVEGDDFYQYSKLFAKHAEDLLPLVDSLGTRIRVLGGVVPVMPADVLAMKTVDDPSDAKGDDEDMIQNLCSIHEHFIKSLRHALLKITAAKDAGSHELLVSHVLRVHENQLWVVRSSLD